PPCCAATKPLTTTPGSRSARKRGADRIVGSSDQQFSWAPCSHAPMFRSSDLPIPLCPSCLPSCPLWFAFSIPQFDDSAITQQLNNSIPYWSSNERTKFD